ncbi:MAG: hypothetical protein GEU28_07620 [Dehalococcoidia bacterium]|nr:hypothetical protein [Dehalococcoidia bacterium]
MYGWRGRIGFISPSHGFMLRYEFHKMAPDGVLFVNTGGRVRRLADDDLEDQLSQIEERGEDLVQLGVEAIIIGGSPLFTRLGYGSERQISERIEQKLGVPVVAHIEAEVQALRQVGIRKLVVASPFKELIYRRMESYLQEAGFDVVAIAGLGIERNVDIDHLPDYAAYRLAKSLYFGAGEAVDGVLITCPRWPTIQHIDLLELETGKPVITSSQAVTWKALEMLKVPPSVPGFGRLLAVDAQRGLTLAPTST